MRAIFLIIATILFENAHCQNLNKISIQIELGLNSTIPFQRKQEIFPEFQDHPIYNYKPGIGYDTKISISYQFNMKMSVQSGISFQISRLNKTYTVAQSKETGIINSKYLNIPVAFCFKPSITSPFTLTIGPFLGIPISIKDNGTSFIDTSGFIIPGGNPQNDPRIASINPISTYEHDLKKYFKEYDIGLEIDFVYALKKPDRLSPFIFSKFNYGLLNVYLEDNPNRWKRYVVCIGLGFKL